MKLSKIKIIKGVIMLLVFTLFTAFFGFMTSIKIALLLIVCLIFIYKYHAYFNLIFRRYLLIFLMMCLSIFSILLSLVLVSILTKYLNIDKFIINWISLFENKLESINANTIMFLIVMIFFPAYHVYSFLLIKFRNLTGKWLKNNETYNWLVSAYDQKLFLAYFTIIIVFMGILPFFTTNIITNIKITDSFNQIIFSILMFSLLPSSYLLFREAKK
ncbi:hypothetical protein [Metabacillus fastidiosus]|uniref:hypothetical protein n=1 Tax=Metabacillus fastidiosus TaxID=1458 RepID=UPI003D288512